MVLAGVVGKDAQGDAGAGFGIGEGMVVAVKRDAEVAGNGSELMVGQFGEGFARLAAGAVEAVFRSWDNPRANVYRRDNDIPYSWGTAVNVQMMAFGNMGDTSGTGVAFTRDPATGEKKLMGEFLMNAQGEDVVAGVRTPQHIDQLKQVMPEVYDEFVERLSTF